MIRIWQDRNYSISCRTAQAPQAGSALLLVMIIVAFLMLSGVALMTRVIASNRLATTDLHSLRALYIAEAGIERARWRLGLEDDLTNTPPNDNLYINKSFGGGVYSVTLSERAPRQATIRSCATYADSTRTIMVRVKLKSSGQPLSMLYWKEE